jgi:hypothetical protein
MCVLFVSFVVLYCEYLVVRGPLFVVVDLALHDLVVPHEREVRSAEEPVETAEFRRYFAGICPPAESLRESISDGIVA